jgi:enoyl-CoA hydratase
MKAYENILTEVKDGICTLTMNRPKALNALNPETIADLDSAFHEIRDDDKIKVVILTGGTGKAFVAGADISRMVDMDIQAIRDYGYRTHEVFNFIDDFQKPVIAAVNGFALGGGCELAMVCDIRLASETAKFGQPEVNLGTIPFFGGTQRLTRLVGKGMANYLCTSAELIDGKEAHRIGLVERVYPADQLLPEAEKLAKTIISKSPLAIKAVLGAIANGYNADLKTGLNIELESVVFANQSQDRYEGMKAFLEKRPANFQAK